MQKFNLKIMHPNYQCRLLRCFASLGWGGETDRCHVTVFIFTAPPVSPSPNPQPLTTRLAESLLNNSPRALIKSDKFIIVLAGMRGKAGSMAFRASRAKTRRHVLFLGR